MAKQTDSWLQRVLEYELYRKPADIGTDQPVKKVVSGAVSPLGIPPLDNYVLATEQPALLTSGKGSARGGCAEERLRQALEAYPSHNSETKALIDKALKLINIALSDAYSTEGSDHFSYNLTQLGPHVFQLNGLNFNFNPTVIMSLVHGFCRAAVNHNEAYFFRQLRILKRNPKLGWIFWGKFFYSLSAVYDEAIVRYKRAGRDFDNLKKQDPEALQVLELRPLLLELLQLKTENHNNRRQVFFQDIHCLKLNYRFVFSNKSFHKSLAVTPWQATGISKTGLAELLKELQTKNKKSVKCYRIASATRFIGLRIARNYYELFDSSYPGFWHHRYESGEEMLVVSDIAKSLHAHKESGNVLFNISSVFSASCTTEEKEAYRYELHKELIDITKCYRIDTHIINSEGASLLYLAAESANTDVIADSLKNSPDLINYSTEVGKTPLYVACEQGHFDVVDQLVEAGADIFKPDNNAVLPIQVASIYGHTNIILRLLKQGGADVNQPFLSKGGYTLLAYASENGWVDLVTALLECGADPNQATLEDGLTPLALACRNGHERIMEKLVLHRDTLVDKRSEDEQGLTPLFIASKAREYQIVKKLIVSGADVNTISLSELGDTPLTFACRSNDLELAKTLLQSKKLDVNKPCSDFELNTPLQIACELVHLDIIRLLLKHPSIEPNYSCQGPGNTSLVFRACKNGQQAVLELLAECNKVDINLGVVDPYELSPLYFASTIDDLDTIKTLLKKHAHVADETIWYAKENSKKKVLSLLLEAIKAS